MNEISVKKPRGRLIGQDGNVFNSMGLVSRAVKTAGRPDQATACCEQAVKAGAYHEVLVLCRTDVDVEETKRRMDA